MGVGVGVGVGVGGEDVGAGSTDGVDEGDPVDPGTGVLRAPSVDFSGGSTAPVGGAATAHPVRTRAASTTRVLRVLRNTPHSLTQKGVRSPNRTHNVTYNSTVFHRTVTFGHPDGLHAGPAWALVDAVTEAAPAVRIGRPGERPVPATDILQVMRLGVRYGDPVVISAEGPDAERVLDELVVLLADNRPPAR